KLSGSETQCQPRVVRERCAWSAKERRAFARKCRAMALVTGLRPPTFPALSPTLCAQRSTLYAYVFDVRSLDHAHGRGAAHDRAIRSLSDSRWRHFIWREFVRL